MPVKVCHIITGLNVGGAEMMLYKLLKNSNKKQFKNIVISLSDIGPIGEKIINECGIQVISLGMNPGMPSLGKLLKLVRLLKSTRPDLIQSWMYHSDFLAFIASRLAGVKHIVWGIHHSDLKKGNNKTIILALAKLCKGLSKFTSKIVCCSNASFLAHKEIGYSIDKMVVIPNGFELSEFQPSKSLKERLLDTIGIRSGEGLLLGTVGRWDVLKDYPNLIDAVGILVNENKVANFKFLICGNMLDDKNPELVKMITEKGLEDFICLLGRRDDIPDIMAAIDLFVLPSKGEGFPNVLGEAMACQTPCITTDVGDSGLIVGNTGLIVPPSDSKALAGAIMKFINLSPEERKELGISARKRIEQNFEIGVIVTRYEDLYLNIVGQKNMN